MKILNLHKNVLSIQKCLLPDCDYLNQNYGLYCAITLPGTSYEVLVKIGLSKMKQITGGVLLDNSVIFFQSLYRTRERIELRDVDYENFRVLSAPSVAITLNVRLVFNDVTALINHGKKIGRLKWITKEILKLYTFSSNSVVFLDNLPECKRCSIYCVDIIHVDDKHKKQDNIYRVSDSTKINIVECIKKKKYEMCYCSRESIKLGGLNQFYKILKEVIEFCKHLPEKSQNVKIVNKILLSGPSGCGKTSLIHTIVRDCKIVLVEVLLPEIFSSIPGETEEMLQNVFNEAKLHAENQETCIILIEDIDVLCYKRSESPSSNITRTVNKLVSLLEEFENISGIVVIGTATNLDDVNPCLRKSKCFDDEFVIMPPSEEERTEIISNILEYFKVDCSQNMIENFALWTPGYVGADLHLALQECILFYNNIKGDSNQLNCHLFENCFRNVLSNITPTSLKGSAGILVNKTVDFTKIGGLNDIKKLLDFCVKQQLTNPEMFMRLGIPLTKGILLYGPPGCAKTTLVKALAKESNMTFLCASSADLYSPYVGDPEKKIVQLFTQARNSAPAIIFIDEIDGLVGSKGRDRMRGVQERVLSTLLVEMDGVGVRAVTRKNSQFFDINCEKSSVNKIIVIGATNRPERLDDALKRPGRFDKIVYVPPPDEKERLNILKKLTENMPLRDRVDLDLLAKETEYYSGADLKNLCYESAIFALTETCMKADYVDSSHFQHVFARTRPSLNAQMIQFYESFQRNIQ